MLIYLIDKFAVCLRHAGQQKHANDKKGSFRLVLKMLVVAGWVFGPKSGLHINFVNWANMSQKSQLSQNFYR